MQDPWEEAAKQFKPKAGVPAGSAPARGGDPWEEAGGQFRSSAIPPIFTPDIMNGGRSATGKPDFSQPSDPSAIKEANTSQDAGRSFNEQHPILSGIAHTVGGGMPAPIPLDLPGSGASMLARGAGTVRGMFGDKAARDAAIEALPRGDKILKWKNLVGSHIPSAEPAAPARTPVPFEDFPADTRGMPKPSALVDQPIGNATEPLEPGRQNMPNPAEDFIKSQIRPIPIRPSARAQGMGVHGGVENTPNPFWMPPASPVNTEAVPVAHPPFAETAPFSPSRAARQMTPAIPVKGEPLGVRGNPKALSIAERLKEEMSRQ